MNKRSGHETKKRIIEAAIKVFSEYGYNGATIRMIAKEAKLSVGCVYLYFKNKEELSLYLLREKMKELQERIRNNLKNLKSPDEIIKKYLTVALQFARENRELIIMQSKEQGFTFGIEIKREFFMKEKAFLTGVINEGINSGIFRSCNSEELSKLIMNIIRGYVLSVVVDQENLIETDATIDFIFNGILKKKEVKD